MEKRDSPNQILHAEDIESIIKRKIKIQMFDKSFSETVKFTTFLVMWISDRKSSKQLDILVEEGIEAWHEFKSEG